jgi:hypothetical protein
MTKAERAAAQFACDRSDLFVSAGYLPAALAALDERDRVIRDLVRSIQKRDRLMVVWARGVDPVSVWCWCGASDDEHGAPEDDAVHASACVALRRLIGSWDGRRTPPSSPPVLAAARAMLEE